MRSTGPVTPVSTSGLQDCPASTWTQLHQEVALRLLDALIRYRELLLAARPTWFLLLYKKFPSNAVQCCDRKGLKLFPPAHRPVHESDEGEPLGQHKPEGDDTSDKERQDLNRQADVQHIVIVLWGGKSSGIFCVLVHYGYL